MEDISHFPWYFNQSFQVLSFLLLLSTVHDYISLINNTGEGEEKLCESERLEGTWKIWPNESTKQGSFVLTETGVAVTGLNGSDPGPLHIYYI